MNIAMYDEINEKINKKKTWVYIPKQLLISRNIKYRQYYVFRKVYNTVSKIYDYFLIVSNDNKNDDNEVIQDCKVSRLDDYGRIKFSIPIKIWNETILCNIKDNMNIDVIIKETNDNFDVYKLDI